MKVKAGISIPEKLHMQIKLMAIDQKTNMNTVITKALKQYVKEHLPDLSDNFTDHECFSDDPFDYSELVENIVKS